MIILFILGVQLLIAGIVVFALRYALNRELIKNALERFEGLGPEDMPSLAERIVLKVARPLPHDLEARLETIAEVKFSGRPIVVLQDDSLRGGMVIETGLKTIDLSFNVCLKNLLS